MTRNTNTLCGQNSSFLMLLQWGQTVTAEFQEDKLPFDEV